MSALEFQACFYLVNLLTCCKYDCRRVKLAVSWDTSQKIPSYLLKVLKIDPKSLLKQVATVSINNNSNNNNNTTSTTTQQLWIDHLKCQPFEIRGTIYQGRQQIWISDKILRLKCQHNEVFWDHCDQYYGTLVLIEAK